MKGLINLQSKILKLIPKMNKLILN